MTADREISFLNANEASLLVGSIPDLKHKVLILLMLDAGLRVSEAISLQFENFDFKKKVLNVRSLKKRKASKDFANRQIPLSPRLFRCLVEYTKEFITIDNLTYLFPSPEKDREHIARDAVQKYLMRLSRKRVNIQNLHPHMLRFFLQICEKQRFQSIFYYLVTNQRNKFCLLNRWITNISAQRHYICSSCLCFIWFVVVLLSIQEVWYM